MNTSCFGEELLFWIQKFSRFPLYVKQQYYSVYWKKGEGKREKRICYTEDLTKWLLSISVVFIIFFIFICIFLFVNSPCEQRQGLAVLSSTTPWLSSKNRANHHDGHTEKWKKKKKKESNHDSILGLPHITTLKPAEIHCCRYHARARRG